jgi:CelD/BcsL family acetyltransferase involved in cellulose biosynthesis
VSEIGERLLDAEVIADIAALEPIRERWDALAVANALPTTSPAWALAWWRNLAAAGSELRVVVVRDGEAVVGVAPFALGRSGGGAIYDLLAADTGRNAPLAAPGHEWSVAEAATGALAGTTPAPTIVRFRSAPLGRWFGPWVAAMRQSEGAARARTILRQSPVTHCPVLPLAGTFEQWLGAKSANFRSEMRRLRKRFASAGATIRTTAPATVDDDLRTYMRLHLARWDGGGSVYGTIEAPLLAALTETAHALGSERFRLYVAEIDGTPIGAQLFLAAGGEIMYHNGGWDEAHARLKPGIVGILHAIEEGFARGDDRVDFGPGTHPYKLRFATGDDPIVATSFAVVGPRLALHLARRSGRRASAVLAGLRVRR